MENLQNPKHIKREYKKPRLEENKIDNQISLFMQSVGGETDPMGQGNDPAGGAIW